MSFGQTPKDPPANRDPSPGSGTAGGRPLTVLVAHPSADLYGSDRVLLESVAGMVAAGWRVEATLPGPGPLVAELTRRGARVTYSPAPVLRKSAVRPAGLARFAFEVAASLLPSCRLLARTGADVVYVNTLTIPTWLVWGRLMGRRVSCHVHEAEGSVRALLRRLLCLPLIFAQQIIVNSRFSLDVLSAANPWVRRRATVIYNGVPGPAQSPSPARAVLTTPVRLLFLGRLSPRKGPQVAIGAVSELRRRGLEVQLDLLGAVFVGYEWFEAELRAAADTAGVQSVVQFLGFDVDIWPHLSASDIVVVPSVLDEPFGNTAVEAMLAARPLVVSATSGLKEAAQGYASATFVPPDQPDALATAVQTIVTDWSRYREQAVHDSAQAEQRHSVQRYQHEVVGLLGASVVAGGRGPRRLRRG